MGTRCGALDPGVVLHLLRDHDLSLDEVEDLLSRRSGLRGLSGISNDMRALLESELPAARIAVDYFVYRIGGELGRMAAALGGIDALIFTAGIGEHAVAVRHRVCEQAAWLGMRLDAAANATGQPCISMPGSSPSAWIIPTNEERMIALHTRALLAPPETLPNHVAAPQP
jgi:acetate kinase